MNTIIFYTVRPISTYVVIPITNLYDYLASTIKTHILLFYSLFDYYDFDEVRNNAELYLLSFLSCGLPDRIYYLYNSTAIDAGGLSRQLFTSLCEGLLSSNYFLRSEEGFPVAIKTEDKVPILNLGKFFSMVYEKNIIIDKKILLGEIFHPSFFELVQIAISDLSQDEKIDQAILLLSAANSAITSTATVIFDPTEENLSAYADVIGTSKEEALETAKRDILQYVDAAEAFYNGSSSVLREAINQNALQTLRELQGDPVSKDNLLNALLFDSCDEIRVIKAWIEQKIRVSSEDWRKKFVFAITGLSTLTPGKKIQIFKTDASKFKFSTCSSTLYIPPGTKSKEEFLEALDLVIELDDFNTQ